MSKSANTHKWTIITNDGASFVEKCEYFQLLDKIYQHYMMNKPKEAGMPNMLLMDGKVVVENGLILLAVQYAKTREEYVVDATTQARMEHKPDWLEIE